MLSLSGISKVYGEQVLFSDVTFNVGPRDRIAVIGPNGSGKTTLFEIIDGNISPDSGSVSRQRDMTIGYAQQDITPDPHERLLPYVIKSSSHIMNLEHRIKILQDALAEDPNCEEAEDLMHELGELQHKYEAAGGYDIDHEAEVILCGLGFKTSDFLRPLSEFSGGWLMRVSLARLLLLNPDLLLLDEPTNHLDLESCIWFEDYLKSYQGAVMVISHDRAFLNRVARKIVAIENEEIIFYQGSYDEFVLARQQDREVREATARRQEIKIKKQMRFVDRFRYKATKAAQVQSRMKALAKIERVEVPRATPRIHFTFPAPPRSGEEVISLKHIVKSYDGNMVYSDLNLNILRNDRIALVGLNGAGKTTLLKILAGVIPFDSGERKLGHNVTTAYYAQYQLELLNPENTALSELHRIAPDEPEQRLRGLLGAFLFSGDDVLKKVAVLSGGEKARLSLAKMLLRPANFLLMDEPTNHLDINSREMLSDALEAYKGTLCFITHDRTLIRETANKIIEIKEGKPIVFQGNYDEYLDWKERRKTCGGTEEQNKYSAQESNLSSRDVQRQRKSAEAELRNRHYKETAALRKHIDQIERKLETLESEYAELESYFADPANYGEGTDVAAKTMRHGELKNLINDLTDEWTELSEAAERKKLAYEREREDIETEYSRFK